MTMLLKKFVVAIMSIALVSPTFAGNDTEKLLGALIGAGIGYYIVDKLDGGHDNRGHRGGSYRGKASYGYSRDAREAAAIAYEKERVRILERQHRDEIRRAEAAARDAARSRYDYRF